MRISLITPHFLPGDGIEHTDSQAAADRDQIPLEREDETLEATSAKAQVRQLNEDLLNGRKGCRSHLWRRRGWLRRDP